MEPCSPDSRCSAQSRDVDPSQDLEFVQGQSRDVPNCELGPNIHKAFLQVRKYKLFTQKWWSKSQHLLECIIYNESLLSKLKVFPNYKETGALSKSDIWHTISSLL